MHPQWLQREEFLTAVVTTRSPRWRSMHSNWKNPLTFVSSLYQKRVLISEVRKSKDYWDSQQLLK